MAKKDKKTFQDRTGIRFADLIMPLVLGGVGSYSNAAGRGVGLGLQAFRTFQSGRAYNDERRAGKEASELYGNIAGQLEDEIGTLKQENSGIIKDSSNPYFDTANLPDPKRPVGEGSIEGMDPNEEPQRMSMFSDPGQFGAEDMESQLGIVEGMDPIDLQNPEALLEMKRRQEEIARDIEIKEGRKRFYDVTAMTAQTNPGAAGYMAQQEQYARIKDDEETRQKLLAAKLLSDSKQEQFALDVMLDGKQTQNKAWYKQFSNQFDDNYAYTKIEDPDTGEEQMVSFDKRTGDIAYQNRRFKPRHLNELPLSTRMDSLTEFSKQLRLLRTAYAEEQDPGTKKQIDMYTDAVNILWASMNNPEDLQPVIDAYNLYVQQKTQVRQQPLEFNDWLKESGIKTGIGGALLPGEGGGGGGGNDGGGYSNPLDLDKQ